MDHDTHDRRIHALEKALDALTDHAWRDPEWLADMSRRAAGRSGGTIGRYGRGDRGAAMVVDEEQTKRDREALGLDKDPAAEKKNAGDDDAKDQALAKAQALAEAKARERDAGNRSETSVQGNPPGPNVTLPKTAVALGAANASPETEAALETAQDPARQAAAEEQVAQKDALDGATSGRPQPV